MAKEREVRDQSTVDRHYRLSKAAYEKILNRDLDRFPTEKDFVSEAVLSYGKGKQIEDLLARYRNTEEKIDRMIKAMGW